MPALKELPAPFIDWQIESRRELFASLLRREQPRFLASHLPVLATANADGTINLCNKGVGLLPREAHIGRYINLFSRVLSETHDHPWEETLGERVEAAMELICRRDQIDARCLGSLEIFEGQTLRNIRAQPSAALLFTSDGPQYLSFQLDCSVEILERGSPVYDFLYLSRQLFERESFHIAQPRYPYAYQFLVCSVREKTPFRRAPAGR